MKPLLLFFLFSIISISCAEFSETAKKSIVDFHNEFRSNISKGEFVVKGLKKEPATNMLKMVWDPEVAKSAQDYANTCKKEHSGTKGLGENLFRISGTDTMVEWFDELAVTSCKVWSGEFEKYGWPYNKLDGPLWGTGVGHATQVSWAETGAIGCGIKACSDFTTVVCQYKNQGNYMGADIYKSGPTCSECPTGTECEKSTGLCAKPEENCDA